MELKDFIKIREKREEYLRSYKKECSKDNKLSLVLTIKNYTNFLNFVSENQMPSEFGGIKVGNNFDLQESILKLQTYPRQINKEKLQVLRELLLNLNIDAPLNPDNYPFFENDHMSVNDKINIVRAFYKSLDHDGINSYTDNMLSDKRVFCEKYSLLYKLYKRSKSLSSLVCLDYCDKSSFISIEKDNSLYFVTILLQQTSLALINRNYPDLCKVIETSNTRILGEYLDFVLMDYLEENKLYLKDVENRRIVNINKIIERVNKCVKYLVDNGIDMSIPFEKQMDKFYSLDVRKIDLALSGIIEYTLYEKYKEDSKERQKSIDILLNGYNEIYTTSDKIGALNLTEEEVLKTPQKIINRIKRR